MALPLTYNDWSAETPASRQPITAAEVEAAITTGDPAAWERLIDNLSGVIRKTLVSLSLPPEIVGDYVQTTWAKAWERRHQFGRDGRYLPGYFINWICRIAHNVHADQSRKWHRRRTYSLADLAPGALMELDHVADATEPLPEAAALTEERQAAARAAVAVALAAHGPSTDPWEHRQAIAAMISDKPRLSIDARHCGQAGLVLAHPHRELGDCQALAAACGITRAAAKSRLFRTRQTARAGICAAYGLPPTATVADVLDRASQREAVAGHRLAVGSERRTG